MYDKVNLKNIVSFISKLIILKMNITPKSTDIHYANKNNYYFDYAYLYYY